MFTKAYLNFRNQIYISPKVIAKLKFLIIIGFYKYSILIRFIMVFTLVDKEIWSKYLKNLSSIFKFNHTA